MSRDDLSKITLIMANNNWSQEAINGYVRLWENKFGPSDQQILYSRLHRENHTGPENGLRVIPDPDDLIQTIEELLTKGRSRKAAKNAIDMWKGNQKDRKLDTSISNALLALF